MSTMSTSHPELLEYLASLVNCEYISDLRCRVPAAAVGRALGSVPAGDFPEEQWRETASYLTGEDCTGKNRTSCRQTLLDSYPARGKKNISRP